MNLTTPSSSLVRPTRPAVHPLGPLVERAMLRHPPRARLVAGLIFVGCAGILTAAAAITPDPVGLGTHRQLGFPPCSAVMLLGYPCPTCGMTTAFAHTVRGQWVGAFVAHPGGLVLALATILAAAASIDAVVTGRCWRVNWYRVAPGRVAVGAVLLVLGGWLFKLVSGIATGTLPVVP